MCECFACVHVCVPLECTLSGKVRGGMRSPGTRATQGCDILCGSWKGSLGLLQKQHELPNTEPFIQDKESFKHLGLLPSPMQPLVLEI